MRKLTTLVLLLISATASGQGWVAQGSNSMSGVNSAFGLGVRVGLGTLSPSHLFHTVGNIRFQALPNTTDTFEVLTVDPSGVVHKRLSSIGSGNNTLAWLLNGNTGVNDAVNFIGTINPAAFVIKTNNTERARFLSSGQLGINYNSPTYQLHVHGSGVGQNLAVTGTSPNATFSQSATLVAPTYSNEGKLGYATAISDFVNTARAGDFVLENLTPTGNLILGTGLQAAPFNGYERMKINPNGFVGINLNSANGLTSPLQTIVTDRFHIRLSIPTYPGAPAQEFVRIENMDTGSGEIVVIDGNGRLHRRTGDGGGDPDNGLAWLLNGNTGVTASNFLGTINAADLIFKTTNAERARFLPTGELGINWSTPTYQVLINSDSVDQNLALTGTSPSITFCQSPNDVAPTYRNEGKIGFASNVGDFVNTATAGDFIVQNVDSVGSLIFGSGSQASPFNGYERMKIDNNGNVGINLTSANGVASITPTAVTDRFHVRLSVPTDVDGLPQEFVRIENMDENKGDYVVIDDNGRLHRLPKPSADDPGSGELRAKIDELSAEIASLKFERALQQTVAPAGTYTMTQNRPNPFKDRTQISYTIGGTYSSAFIAFHDENGREISREQLSKAAGDVTFATNAQPGVIFYSLVVDGQVKCTKKMLKN